jgi:hypothetical protein
MGVRIHQPAGDEQHDKHADEEGNDGEENQAQDIPAIPRRIVTRWISECGGKDLGRSAVTGG